MPYQTQRARLVSLFSPYATNIQVSTVVALYACHKAITVISHLYVCWIVKK